MPLIIHYWVAMPGVTPLQSAIITATYPVSDLYKPPEGLFIKLCAFLSASVKPPDHKSVHTCMYDGCCTSVIGVFLGIYFIIDT